jgi:hypothetical protein
MSQLKREHILGVDWYGFGYLAIVPLENSPVVVGDAGCLSLCTL